jgi:hypothetical protein
MSTLTYVIAIEPTEAEPDKMIRLVGKTNDLTTAEGNCLAGEILVETDLPVNMLFWEGVRAPFFKGGEWIAPDYSNDTPMYCVCLVDDVPTVVLTESPWKVELSSLAQITASLTIS